MHKIQRICLFILLVTSTASHGQEIPFKTVQDLFSAISEVNHSKMKSAVTDDFQLLEVGEDWDINQLIKVVKPSEYFRRNYFSVIRLETSDNFSWVSYWNKATFTKEALVEEVVWLESAVLIKENKKWKIQMLHSTKINPEYLPKNVELTEYKIEI
ncbi:conserved exported hypothetical protein [Alteromonas sp. 38]|uniref:nuclear transport factor 2 family protein n=1 Tax=unclassified Alteromonas TaxID=2614992 RepID=UPI0012F0ADF7|nr:MULTISPECIES: nuclear transport factor 2 family protein [unclassified Alteromonas]CAD5252604.1 conserved exported hypothetical protein [Alteromonas sp. 154]VXB13603.1 conserved exported hypothetical protein [Alteromonas sp. 38]